MLSKKQIFDFQNTVWDYFNQHGRNLPWRNTKDGYAIYISEIMLQQTQVSRVTPKYESFLTRYPDFETLTQAPLADLLAEWSGLGYNRRAKFLQMAAEMIVEKHGGTVPSDPNELIQLPGIGKGTVGSLLAFVHNRPYPFIETNVRRVIIHHFFEGQEQVRDSQILPIVEATLDVSCPRQWYWALMDYGAHLATQVKNPNHRSAHYTKQSKFEGSQRQGRGIVIKCLSSGPKKLNTILRQLRQSGFDNAAATAILSALDDERLITIKSDILRIYP